MKKISYMRHLILYLTVILLISCNTRSSKIEQANDSNNQFREFVKKLPLIKSGYKYDLVKQDAEDSYIPRNSDTLFYEPYFSILGVIDDSSDIVSIIHFEPGDDIYPVLRTYNINGKKIGEEILVLGTCAGWDCDFDSCSENITLINPNTIEYKQKLTITPCDSLGIKDSSLIKNETLIRTFHIKREGTIDISEVKE
jgi:hypothetical protein